MNPKRPKSGEYTRATAELRREVEQYLRNIGPGPAKCASRRDRSKERATEIYRDAFLASPQSISALARELEIDESTLRRRVKHPDIAAVADLLMLPPDRFMRAQQALWRAHRELRDTTTDSQPPSRSGTDG